MAAVYDGQVSGTLAALSFGRSACFKRKLKAIEKGLVTGKKL